MSRSPQPHRQRLCLHRFLAAAATLAAAAPLLATETATRRVLAMGTLLEISVTAATTAAATAAGERAVRAVATVEARLSTWSPGSELARLNGAPVGEPVRVTPELAADLARVHHCREATAGAFDPAIGGLTAAWGLRSGGRRPLRGEVEAALAVGGLTALRLDGETATRLHPGLVLDEGGFGKGVGLDAGLRAAGVACRTVLNLGGQVALSAGEPVTIAIAHPDWRGKAAVWCELRHGSIATSGASERGIVVDGERLGHVLDPRTGEPAPDFGSLSVWAESAAEADCLSTGLYVLGPEAALAWAARHPGTGVLVLERRGSHLRATASGGWPGAVTGASGEVVVERVAER